MSSSQSSREAESSQSPLERAAWPVAGVLLAVVLYYSLPASGPASIGALHDAVITGDLAGVRNEIARGVAPDQPNSSGYTAAHYAALYGRRDVLGLLFEAGGAVDVRVTRTGETPLHRAALGGSVATVEFLLERGADIDARTKRGESPLHLALSNNRPDTALTLFERGADVTGREGKFGRSPLHYAVLSGKRSLVEGMLDRGASVSARTRTGETPLHEAAAGSPSILSLLMDRGADPRAEDLLGNTPIHEAARFNCVTCVERLLAAGASAGARNRAGESPSDVARGMGHQELAEFLGREVAREASTSSG